ncbi:META domain-containing protein [Paracoccus aminovorans]|uniref:META domain-containing protein n=1 Tax=Paracoccus aminovorans TaxID=34004 RepID=UPI0007812230|nr:META domain-containing protein [Paracoccus aminovorans]
MRTILLALPLALAACVTEAETDAAIPGDYALIAVEGVAVSGVPTLRIAEDGAVSGQGPCNSFTGRNRARLPALDLGTLATTRRACLQEGGEHAFFQALAAVREARRDGDALVMTGPDVTIRWKVVTP